MASMHARVGLVTGSSRGLGAVIARRLARDGFAVAVNGRSGDEQVEAVARGIRDEGGTAEGFCADVTDEQQVAGLVAAIAIRMPEPGRRNGHAEAVQRIPAKASSGVSGPLVRTSSTVGP